jgi:hypothetical protein
MELSFYKTFYQDVKETVNKKNNSENKVKELKFILKMYASKLQDVKIVDPAQQTLPLEGEAVNV